MCLSTLWNVTSSTHLDAPPTWPDHPPTHPLDPYPPTQPDPPTHPPNPPPTHQTHPPTHQTPLPTWPDPPTPHHIGVAGMAVPCTEKTKWVYFDGESGSSTPFIFHVLHKFPFFSIFKKIFGSARLQMADARPSSRSVPRTYLWLFLVSLNFHNHDLPQLSPLKKRFHSEWSPLLSQEKNCHFMFIQFTMREILSPRPQFLKRPYRDSAVAGYTRQDFYATDPPFRIIHQCEIFFFQKENHNNAKTLSLAKYCNRIWVFYLFVIQQSVAISFFIIFFGYLILNKNFSVWTLVVSNNCCFNKKTQDRAFKIDKLTLFHQARMIESTFPCQWLFSGKVYLQIMILFCSYFDTLE